MKYLLIWDISGYEEDGGGQDYEIFNELTEMDIKINKLLVEYGDKFTIMLACRIAEIYQYVPTEVVRKLARTN